MCCLLLLLTGLAPGSHAIDIVVNDSIQLDTLSRKELLAIYTMRQRYWPDGTPIIVYMLNDNNLLNEFCKKRLKIFPHQLRSRWDRLVYSGTGSAPSEVISETDMIKKIASTHGAIGFVGRINSHDHIKTIAVH